MKKILKDPILLMMFIIITAALTLFVILPIINVFRFPEISDYRQVFSDVRYRRATLNSLFIMTLSTLSATLFGFIYAYAIVKTTFHGKKFFKLSPSFRYFLRRSWWRSATSCCWKKAD